MIRNETIGGWVDALSSGAPVPGGGGASALAGALAAALGCMVANLTVGKKKYAGVEPEMLEHLAVLEGLRERMFELVKKDAEVFAPLAAAYRLPKETPAQQAQKERVMEECLAAASQAPLEIMETANEMLDILDELEEKGSRMAVSDAGVAAQFARTALTGAAMNVYINTKAMKNREKAEQLNDRAAKLAEVGVSRADEVYDRVRRSLFAPRV